jgi:peptidoglycan/LPS O-acetylase OafA/YrhL
MLRAAAVLSVVIFHFWPNRLPGGFVGVDVFFVISGFLITSLIVREIKSTGRLNLVNFWVRRIRRIFPASIVVIAATAGTVTLIGSPDLLTNIGRHVFASAFSWENVLLAADQADYFRSTEAPSPLQHFWSLAVEEQFYVVWPLLVVGVVIATRGFLGRVRMLFAIVVTIVAVSAGYATLLTLSGEPTAYYNSLARAWELGLGAFIAILAARGEQGLSDRFATWVNRIAWSILLVVFFIPGLEMGVPSWGVAPAVVLTAIAIATGNRRTVHSSHVITRTARGIGQWIGDRSFSLYLWHWPILVLAPYVINADLHAVDKVAAIALALVLSEISFRFVETPIRNARTRIMRNPFFVVPVAGIVSVALTLATIQTVVATEKEFTLDITSIAGTMSGEQTDERTILSGLDVTGITPFCLGAGAAVFDCPPSKPSNGTIDIKDDPRIAAGCPGTTQDVTLTCILRDENAATNVLFIGDSHARGLAGAMDIVGNKMGWRIDTYAHGHCTFSEISLERCETRNQLVLDKIFAGEYDLVVTAQAAYNMKTRARQVGNADPAVLYERVWRDVIDSGVPMVTFADVPTLSDKAVRCMRQNFKSLNKCSMTPKQAWRYPDYAVTAAERVGVHVVDLRPVYCEPTLCPLSIGSVRVMIDFNHVTPQFAATLAPFIWSQMSTFNLP